jgi:chorismate dehydratase
MTTLQIGYIPYLNMIPFHQGFGPETIERGLFRFQFQMMSPRALGLEAAKGAIDAGALSLVDGFQVVNQYEPLGRYGIGVKKAANSVLLFSKKPLQELAGAMIAVTDETSTSYRLLQLLLEQRHRLTGVRYGRIASIELYDGSADAVLLIGDEALEIKRKGVKGLPIVTDLGEAWHIWQGIPFVFARWMVKKTVPKEVKVLINEMLEKSLSTTEKKSRDESSRLDLRAGAVGTAAAYWDGFVYRLTDAHLEAIERFSSLLKQACEVTQL